MSYFHTQTKNWAFAGVNVETRPFIVAQNSEPHGMPDCLTMSLTARVEVKTAAKRAPSPAATCMHEIHVVIFIR
jgi:hypothetical protein